jgi:exopolysaccharide biosynthesis polyprenyl glycosylphosphotransferase
MEIEGAPASTAGTVSSESAETGRRRGWLVRRMLVTADVIALVAAFAITELLFRNLTGGVGEGAETVVFLLTLPVWILTAGLYGLYDRDERFASHSTADEVMSIFHLVTVVLVFWCSVSWLLGLVQPDLAKLATFWLLAFLGMITARVAARSLGRRQPSYVQNAVVVGAGDVGQLIGRKLGQHPEYRINLLGYVDATPREFRADVAGVQLLGEPGEIVDIVERYGIDRVIVAFSQDRPEETLQLVRALEGHKVQIDAVPRLYEAVGPKTEIHWIEGLPVLRLTATRIPRSSLMVKRALDILGAGLLLVLTAPLMLVIAVLIRRDSGAPVFFRQTRLGMDMREFTMLKFRTMHDGTDAAPHLEHRKQIMTPSATPTSSTLYKLDRSDAGTRVGRWLRRTSLDELPQLLNVIRGDMSLVGPRPSIPYELALFAPHHFERFNVPAGVTGLWQVGARAHSTYREALDLDVLYARSWSLGLDLRLLFRTPGLMFKKRMTT